MKLPNVKNIEALQKNKYFELLPDFKEDRIKKFTTLALTLFALAVFSLFAINPTLSTIAKLRKELEDNKFVDQQLERKLNSLNSLEQNFTQIQNDIPVILSAVPYNPQIPLLTAEIEGAAQQNNLNIITLQSFEVEVLETKTKNNFPSFSFAITVEGDQSSINSFLDELIGMRRIITPETISIYSAGEENELTRMTFKGRSYFKNE